MLGRRSNGWSTIACLVKLLDGSDDETLFDPGQDECNISAFAHCTRGKHGPSVSIHFR